MKKSASRRSSFPMPGFLQRLPFWLGTLVVSFVPVRVLASIDYIMARSAIGGLVLDFSLVISVLMVYLLYAMRYIWRKIGELEEYAGQFGTETTRPLARPSFTPRTVILIWLILLGANTVLFPTPGALVEIFAEGIPVFAYFFLILAAFLYVYGSSMFAIYRAGKRPMKLKQFTEDRTLGLKPFGTTSLKLTSIYAIFPIVITIVQLVTINLEISGEVSVTAAVLRPSDIIFIAALVIVGVALFFLPLLSIHRRLVDAKQNELSWIAPQYTAIVQRLKNRTAGLSQQDNTRDNEALSGELTTVRQIHNDIQRIQTWPFDIGVIARMATVLVLPPVLGVVARILILLVLHV